MAISEFSREEGLAQLDVEPERIVTVSTAIENEFKPMTLTAAEEAALRRKFGLQGSFVMYTGGTDDRKNLPRLIQAYAQLPVHIRQKHQLVLVGKIDQSTQTTFKALAKKYGLEPHELCLVGYVSSEELIQLYNLCALFVFPSWHEGFGLPALEAMACGAPVIGANNSSLPEVIDYAEALFDPFQVEDITAKMRHVLEDPSFAQVLREHGLQRAPLFSWDETAKRTWQVWEQAAKPQINLSETKPKLAFVSPLQPERTGIADYSTELLPVLAEHYDIELVVAQEQVDQPWSHQHYTPRDENWLRDNAHKLDRVLYQVGNSAFHAHMLDLIRDVPGVVVQHDFYLSGLYSWLEIVGGQPHRWVRALYDSHGYLAVQQRFQDEEQAKAHYPVSFEVVSQAKGVIVHSDYSCQLARQWYGSKMGQDWAVIPHLREPALVLERAEVRQELGLHADDFVICSFGFLDHSKHNLRLLEAWLGSRLAQNPHCKLIFVGGLPHNAYGDQLVKTIKNSRHRDQVHITGFMPADAFKQYLSVADMAVQLRTQSRGETSGTVLDCLNYGLPLIMNANGSMAEVDSEAVWMLPDEFNDEQLIEALESLWQSPEKRQQLAEKGLALIAEKHDPQRCARQYMEAIEQFYHRPYAAIPELAPQLVDTLSEPSEEELLVLAQHLAKNMPQPRPAKRLFLDVTATQSHDLKTGIERVVRSMLLALLQLQPQGYRVEPVYLQASNEGWHYRYACQYTLGLLGCPSHALIDEVVEFQAGDLLITMDLSGAQLTQAYQSGLFSQLRHQGVTLFAMLYDLLPLQMPHVFPPGADQSHLEWAKTIAHFDGAIAISKTVADDFMQWRSQQGIEDAISPFRMGWVHLGADVENSAPSKGMPASAEKTLAALSAKPSFLMVGTIEPRKGYLQTIQAFTQLWQQGVDVNLVIVGREGWQGLDNALRRDIPETVETLKHHPELGRRLFWLEGISDEYLEQVYNKASCLIAASYGEGFGLPLIEAAQAQLPIIARNIPIFKEVAAEHAFYFEGSEPTDLAQAIQAWLCAYEAKSYPQSTGMPWLMWRESAQSLLQQLINKNK